MSPLDSSDDDNVPIHLINEIVMDTVSVDYTYFLNSDDDDLCLTINAPSDPDHEVHVGAVDIKYSYDCLSSFVSTFGGFATEVNNTCYYDYFIRYCKSL